MALIVMDTNANLVENLAMVVNYHPNLLVQVVEVSFRTRNHYSVLNVRIEH